MKPSLCIFVKLSAMQWMPLIGYPGLLYNIGTAELDRFVSKLLSLTTYFSVDISRDPRDVSILLFSSLTSPRLHTRVTSGEISPHLVHVHDIVAISRPDKLCLCNLTLGLCREQVCVASGRVRSLPPCQDLHTRLL